MTCQTCRHWTPIIPFSAAPSTLTNGECRRFPPVPVFLPAVGLRREELAEVGTLVSVTPQTASSYGCGEFQFDAARATPPMPKMGEGYEPDPRVEAIEEDREAFRKRTIDVEAALERRRVEALALAALRTEGRR